MDFKNLLNLENDKISNFLDKYFHYLPNSLISLFILINNYNCNYTLLIDVEDNNYEKMIVLVPMYCFK